MKKIKIMMCLVALQILSFSSKAQLSANETIPAVEINSTLRKPIKYLGKASFATANRFILKDLDGNEFILEEGKSGGYAIYDPVSGVFMEKSDSGINPYKGYVDEEKIYLGPMNYYVKNNDRIYSIYDGISMSTQNVENLQDVFTGQLNNTRREINRRTNKGLFRSPNISMMSAGSNRKYIPNSHYVSTTVHPENIYGNCGFVAASLVLNWWDKTQKWCIPSKFREADGNLVKRTRAHDNKYDLAEHLVKLNNGENASWGLTVRDTLVRYCQEIGVGATIAYYLGSIGLAAEINAGRPGILFGSLPDVEFNRGILAHAVAVYGVENHWWGSNFIVNYGWNSPKSNAVILNGWLAGSVTTFRLK